MIYCVQNYLHKSVNRETVNDLMYVHVVYDYA